MTSTVQRHTGGQNQSCGNSTSGSEMITGSNVTAESRRSQSGENVMTKQSSQ